MIRDSRTTEASTRYGRMVGLLAAVGAAMSMVASLVHGDLFWAAVAAAAAATGLAAYLALPPRKSLHPCRTSRS
jgi:hypothetical protein